METDSGNPLPESQLLLFFTMPNSGAFWGVLAVLLLLLTSIFLAAVRVAFFSLTTRDFQKISVAHSPTSRRILALRQEPQLLHATLVISSSLILIGILLLVNYFIFQLLQPQAASAVFASLPLAQNTQVIWANTVGFSMTTAILTFFMLLFGEVTPKNFAQQNRFALVRWTAAPMLILMQIFYPLSIALLAANKFIDKRLFKSIRNAKNNGKDTTEEINELGFGNHSNGDKEASDQEVDMLKSIVKFSDVTVRQIMTSRMDVVAVDEQTTYPELLEIVTESGYSRIPVYEDDFDNIRGILYVKDLLKHLKANETLHWQSLVRPEVLYVPESKKISDVLREFQKRRLHMAIVVDEYGGSSGIVTLEDVLEEIIGDIRDEFDDEAEVQYRQLDEQTYIFEGKTMLTDVYRITGIKTGTFDEVRGEADSLAGLILAMHGQLPKKDLELTFGNFRFKIIAVSKRRIEQVQITNSNLDLA